MNVITMQKIIVNLMSFTFHYWNSSSNNVKNPPTAVGRRGSPNVDIDH
jgi:hypothetical protein